MRRSSRMRTDDDEDDRKPPSIPRKQIAREPLDKKTTRTTPSTSAFVGQVVPESAAQPPARACARLPNQGDLLTEKRHAARQGGHGMRPGAVAVGPSGEAYLSRSREASIVDEGSPSLEVPKHPHATHHSRSSHEHHRDNGSSHRHHHAHGGASQRSDHRHNNDTHKHQQEPSRYGNEAGKLDPLHQNMGDSSQGFAAVGMFSDVRNVQNMAGETIEEEEKAEEKDESSFVGYASEPHLPPAEDKYPTYPPISLTDAGLAIAAEVAPTEADLEARVQERVHQERKEIVSEVQKQIMAQAGSAEVVTIDEGQGSNKAQFCSRRRNWMILLGLLATVVVVVVVLVIVLLPESESEPDPEPEPDNFGCTLCADGYTPANLGTLTLGDDGVTCSEFNRTQVELNATSDACIQGQAEAWRSCNCPSLPLFPTENATCTLCMNASIPLENPQLRVENKTCADWNTYIAHIASDSDECNALRTDLWDVFDQCKCTSDPTLRQYLIHILFPLSGNALLEDGTPQSDALKWLATEDPANLTADAGDVVLRERYIFALLYFATEGPSWQKRYSFLSIDNVCSWNDGDDNGVICVGNAIDKIRLGFNSLKGSLPAEISALSTVRTVELRSNGLVGAIPPAFGDLSGLERFDVDVNSLTGELPTSLFTIQTLKELWLDGNHFSGSLPSFFGTALTSFTCKGCSLSGTIPPSIGDLSDLFYLDLSMNNFTGGVPAFSGSKRLQQLRLHENDLTGPLPSSLGNLLRLERLHILNNRLTGTIPRSIADLPALSLIEIQGNQLDGPLPPFTGQQVSQVWAYGNNLTGTLDGFFSSTASATMTVVRLEENQFTGTLPESIGNFTQLEEIDLASNKLSGPISTSIGHLAKLTYLDFSTNDLSGTLPSTIGALSRLKVLLIMHNFLNGTIPRSIGSLPSLVLLALSENYLTGNIPPFTSLEIGQVWLDGNLLTGGLEFFNSTPSENLTNVHFEENRLTGSLPEAVGNFVQLEEFVLNENLLTGSIPSMLGNLVNAVHVLLNKAGVTGSIPSELGRLTSVENLDLGQNDFSGTVPTEMGSCASLVNLGFALCGLTGSFPASVANLPDLEDLLIHGNDFTNDFEATFCSRADEIDRLIANCLVNTIDCSCCTMCCQATGFNCIDQ